MDKLRIIQYQSDAADSCKTRGININDHFRDFTKMVDLGSEAKCYLALCQWQNVGFPAVKSRSDDTLLTVDAICGQNDVRRSAKSRRDDPELNSVSSLRDFAAIRQVRKYTFDPKLERRVVSDEKSIEKTTQKLPKKEKTK